MFPIGAVQVTSHPPPPHHFLQSLVPATRSPIDCYTLPTCLSPMQPSTNPSEHAIHDPLRLPAEKSQASHSERLEDQKSSIVCQFLRKPSTPSVTETKSLVYLCGDLVRWDDINSSEVYIFVWTSLDILGLKALDMPLLFFDLHWTCTLTNPSCLGQIARLLGSQKGPCTCCRLP